MGIDKGRFFRNNPAPSGLMNLMKSSPHIVVLSPNPVAFSQGEKNGPESQMCLVKDLEALKREAQMRPVDGLVIDCPSDLEPLGSLANTIDLSHTVVLAGTLPVTVAAARLKHVLGQEDQKPGFSKNHKDVTLEDYVESKFVEFVKAMKVSSARRLHDTLIRAVERPLIKLALQETNGNQVQAAQLLGMNRNTLRKKITEFKIPIKRRSPSSRDRHLT